MIEKKTSTAKIVIWYTISSILAKGIAFISTPFFTRLMTKSDFGLFNNFTSWESIIAIIVTVDFTVSVTRAKYDYEGRINEYLSSILVASNIATILFYFLIESFSSYFEGLFDLNIFYIRIIFVYLLFSPAFDYLQVKHRIYKKYKFFVLFSLTSALIRTLFSVLLVYYMHDKFLGRVYGYILPMIALNFSLWMYIIYKGRKVSFDCIKYGALISIPLIPHALSGILLGSSDRVMITTYNGPEQTAMYSLAYQVALLANIIWSSMNKAWAPWLYDNIHANNVNVIRKKSIIYLGVFSILIIGVFFITPEFLLLMGGRQYMDAVYCMPPVILACFYQFVYGMYVNLEIYEKKTYLISIGTVSAALINLCLNFIFIPKYGYLAAAYTTLVSYFALFVFHYLIVKKISFSLFLLYDRRFIWMLVSLMTLIGFISLISYNYPPLRYIALTVYVLSLFYTIYRYRLFLFKLINK